MFSYSVLNTSLLCSNFSILLFVINKKKVYVIHKLITKIDKIINARCRNDDFKIIPSQFFIFHISVNLLILGIQSRISRTFLNLSKHFDVLPNDCIEKPRPYCRNK